MKTKEIKENIKKLKEEINTIYNEADRLRHKFLDSKIEIINANRDKIRELKDLLLSTKRPEVEVPEDIKEWFREYKSGVDWGYGGIKIIYISPKKKYVIVTNKGAIASTGSFWEPHYFPSTHWAVKVGDTENLSKIKCIGKIEGRLTKDKEQEMINQILELEK